jgi:flagellar motor component MotA
VSPRDQITTACGNYIGIAERGHTALACLKTAGITDARALPIVAAQLAAEVEAAIGRIRASWRTASDYMPSDEAGRIAAMEAIVQRLRALTSTQGLHPVMAEAVAPFLGIAA